MGTRGVIAIWESCWNEHTSETSDFSLVSLLPSGSHCNGEFNILRNHQTVFHGGGTLYIPISDAQELQFLRVLAKTCYFLFPLFDSHLNWYMLGSHCGFDSRLPNSWRY